MNVPFYCEYTLQSSVTLNSRSERREHQGALIRIDSGYGCIHPWPELGDLPIAEQLARLREGKSTPLIRQALHCAEVDGAARVAGRSLFENPIPPSHWLVLPGDDPEVATSEGFSVAKIKLGRDLDEERKSVARWVAAGMRVRLDFNESLSLSAFLEFWYGLGDLRDSIEYLEDPTEWVRGHWSTLKDAGIPIAVDREVEARFESEYVAVVKPALSGWVPPAPERFLVTCYMEHAMGQMWAAAEASRIAAELSSDRLLECGLLAYRCFETDQFFDRFEVRDTRLISPGGTGLGFDDLLEKLPWKRLD